MVDEAKQNTDDTKKLTLEQAIEAVNQGVENLSIEELNKLYSILKAHSGEMSPAGEAFAKLDAFAQQQVQDFADGKENCAPEDLEGMKALAQEVASVHKSTENQDKTTQRVNQEQRNLDATNNLTHLTPDFAPTLDKNIAEMDALIAGKDLLAQTADKKLEYQELASFAAFFDNIDLSQDKDGIKDKDELRKEMLEMAIMQAEAELAILPEFANLSADEKRKKLFQAIGAHADALVLESIKAQLIAEFKEANAGLLSHKENLTEEEKKELEEKTKELKDELTKRVESYANRQYSSGHYSINNQVATVVLITNSREQVAISNRIVEKTGSKTLKDRALAFDKRMKEKHPKLYKAVKKGMLSLAVGSTFGSVGLACLAGYNTYKLYKEQQKKYRESGFEGSYMEYLKKNPKEAVALITSGTLTAVSAAFGGADVVEHGWNAVGFVGRAIGDTAAAKAGNRLLKAAIRGGISVTSGLTNAGMDFRAALNTKDKAQRKKLYKQAAITAGVSVVGGAIGILSAEYGDKIAGKLGNWLRDKFSSNDTGADSISETAPKVDTTHVQTQVLNGNELDAKLHELGVNPKVYENMSPMQKEMLLHKRIEELGPLAKETPAAQTASDDKAPAGSKSPENTSEKTADTGPVTESQLKNMLKRNAERHPDVDMTKVYSQLKAAGIKNPEEAFYKLEQSRLLAPNDKIMTVDGTNVRSTLERALKGEALTKADMEIISRSTANVDNTGHYLNDVRSQGGTGYSYRPNGKIITSENEVGTKIKGNGSVKSNIETHPEQGNGDKKTQTPNNPQPENNTTEKPDNKQTTQPQQQDENGPYAIHEGDGKDLIEAKREAARAEAAWKAAVEKVKLTGKGVEEVKDLPLTDAKRIEAEVRHAEAMKDEVKKQMAFSKKEIKLAKAERNQLGDELAKRIKMEERMSEIREDLKRHGLDKTDAPTMTGDYGEDRRAVRDYYKDVISNKKNQKVVMELLKEREDLYNEMKEQGPRQLMEQRYEAAEAKVDELSRREQYRLNQEKEVGENRSETQTATPKKENEGQNDIQPKKENEGQNDAQPKKENEGQAETEPKSKEENPLERVSREAEEFNRQIDKKIESFSTTSLSAAEKLNNNELFSVKDKMGNNQYVGVDENGHSFKLTEVTNGGPDLEISGVMLKIEVSKDHPMYQALNDPDSLKRATAEYRFYKNFQEKCVNGQFKTVKPVQTVSRTNTSEGR